MQAFRSRVYGRGESRRACAHDGDVEELVVIRGVENAEAARQRVFRRIEEHFAVGAQRQYVGHHRTILGQQCRSGIVLCRVDHLMWMTVAAQEILQTQYTGRLRTADQHRSARAGFDESDTAEDQCPHDALTKIRFCDDQRTQLLGRHQKCLDVVLGIAIHQRVATRELRDLGEKLSASLLRDGNDATQPIALRNRHRPFQHDKHPWAGLARCKQASAARISLHRAETFDARDLGVRQRRKHLMASRRNFDLRFVGHQDVTGLMRRWKRRLRGKCASPRLCNVVPAQQKTITLLHAMYIRARRWRRRRRDCGNRRRAEAPRL